jgi:hypothetical protein
MFLSSSLAWLLALTGSAQPATFSQYTQIKKVVYAFDFDRVVAYMNTKHVRKLVSEYFQKHPHKVAPIVLNPWFWADVKAAHGAVLYNESGARILGYEATIDYLVRKYITWATENDKVRFSQAVSAVIPNDEIIDYATNLNVPYVVWTNNDKATYDIKVTSINGARAKAGKSLFEPSHAYTVIPTGKPGSNEPWNTKAHVEYFDKTYRDTCAQFGLQPGELLVIFIDDNINFIRNAKKAAVQYNFPIKAYQYTGSLKTLEEDFRFDEQWFDIFMQAMNK